MSAQTDFDVIVVGAGPVGLFLANLLAQRGMSVFIADRRDAPPVFSMAIGVTPPSLNLLSALGLDSELISLGVKVNTARIFEAGDEIGVARFHNLPGSYPFILSVPQSTTTSLLERAARGRSAITLCRNHRFLNACETADGVTATFAEGESGKTLNIGARLLVGCDGHKSPVREQLRLSGNLHGYSQRWIMADFKDDSRAGSEAHLYFSGSGSVESFPLSGQRRRWIVQLPGQTDVNAEEFLFATVAHRCGVELQNPEHGFSVFGARRFTARRYGSGRMLLCGDAAHVMSSVGGQGMNVGFADAAALAELIPDALENNAACAKLVDSYTGMRRPAALSAASRASWSMRLGTGRGWWFSQFRRKFLGALLASERGNAAVVRHFAMLTLPGATGSVSANWSAQSEICA